LFPALFYLSTLTGRTVFLRYMIPLLPFFCLAAGWWLSALMERVGMRFWPVFVVGAAVLWWTPLSDSIRTDRLLSQSDTRNLAAEWLLAEVGEGSHSIHQTGAKWGQLQLPLTRDSLAVLRSRALHARSVPGLERLRAYTLMQANARLTGVQDSDLGFRTVAFSGTSGPTASGFLGEEVPEWIAVMRSPLIQYSIVPEPLDSILAADYALAVEFRASRAGRTGWYDQHDAFYLPFKRMDSVARPGPDVSLYRRTAPADSVGTNPGGIR